MTTMSLVNAQTGTEVSFSGTILVDEHPPGDLAPKIIVELNMTGREGEGIRAVVNKDGEFWFYQLQPGIYHLFARLDGYFPVSSRIDLNSGGQVRGNVKLVLLKEAEMPTITREGEVVSQNELRASPKVREQTSRGEQLLAAGDTKAAMKSADQALKSFPDYARALHLKGRIFRATGETEKAIQHFRRALAADKDFYATYPQLVELLKEEDRLEELQTETDRWKAVEPLNALPYYFSGIAQYELGDYEAALQDVQFAFGLPHDKLPHLRLLAANCHVKLNQLALAAEQLRTFIQEYPTDPEVAAATRNLEQIDQLQSKSSAP